ncbi:hypothetical protein X777_08770, partial [Ooceraea biroi]
VYKIDCKNCNAIYVGQTSRHLKTRLLEHKNHIVRNTSTHSVITEHRLNFDHVFDWENIRILDNKRLLHKRLTSEMIYINLQDNGLNLQTDTESLHNGYRSVLSKLK